MLQTLIKSLILFFHKGVDIYITVTMMLKLHSTDS